MSGIAKDDQGNYLVVERLRSVVMVFDKEFRFLQEFGYRGDKPGNLIRPNEVAVGNAGKTLRHPGKEPGSVGFFTSLPTEPEDGRSTHEGKGVFRGSGVPDRKQ